jgi:ubiquinone/menaquinone biosynthesis C-methylase UbiE
MNPYLEQAEKYARDYDKGAAEQGYHGPDVLFGLMFEYLKEKNRLIDIAIGTGLDAALFTRAGALVYGIDGAAEMLTICREKNVAHELRQVDLLAEPVPYPDGFFDLAVANSIFHMIENPHVVFKETLRVLKGSGVFGFTFDEMKTGKPPKYRETELDGIFRFTHPGSGLHMYRHSDELIRNLCTEVGLILLKKLEFLTFLGKDGLPDFYFTAYITRKQSESHQK